MLSIEDLIDTAEEIFSDLAPENLSSELLQLLQDENSKIFIEAKDELSDWDELLSFEIQDNEYVEIDIFLQKPDDSKQVLAKILLAVDEDEKDCHILWEIDE